MDEGDKLPGEAAPKAPGKPWWCLTCNLRVLMTGADWGRRTVHLATGLEEGPGGDDGPGDTHTAIPTDQSPEIREEAAKVKAEFGKWFHVAAGDADVRAWLRAEFQPPGVIIPATYYGKDTDELRPQLRAALAVSGVQP